MTVSSAAPETAAAPAGFVDVLARGEYIRLSLGCFLVSFASAHSSLLALVFERDGYDLHAIGLLLSLISVPIIALALLSGEVMARLGSLQTLRFAMLFTLVGFGMLLLTRQTFAPALMSRLVQGVGQGLFLAAAYTYVGTRIDSTRFLFLLGVFSATMPLATAIAPPFGGYVLQRWGEPAFFVLATVPGIVGLLLTFTLRAVPRPPPTKKLQLFAGARRDWWEPLIAVLLNGTMMGFCNAYLAAALVRRNVPLAAFFTPSLVTMFASRLLALRSIEAIDRRLLVATGLALLSVGFVLVASTGNNVALVVLGGIAFGFGYSLTYPVLSAWISEGIAAEERGGSQALLNALFNAGLYVMPLPETWLIAGFGYETTMLVLAASSFTMAAVLALRTRSRG